MRNLVVLSGGGFKSAYQVGALQQIQGAGLSIDCIMGTSGGALNGVLASCCRINDMEDIWNSIAEKGINSVFESELIDLKSMKVGFNKLVKLVLSFIGLRLLTKKGRDEFKLVLKTRINSIEYLATSNGLRTLLNDNVDSKELKIPFYFNFNDLTSGQEIISSRKDYLDNNEFINGIVASATIPLILKPQKVFTKNAVYSKCVDGGVSSNVLIHQAVKYIKGDNNPNDWRIIVINCNSPKLEKVNSFNGIVPIFERVVLGIMLNTLTRKELNTITIVNELATDANQYLHIPFYSINPELDDLGSTMEIDKNINEYRIKRGIEDANKFLKLI